jgi:urease subunit gamma/beta
MHLTPADRERLLIFQVAELARRRLARGLLLNVPEATAVVADAVCEAARDGARLAEAVTVGRLALRPEQVLPGVAAVVREVVVEAVFEDGTRLVVVREPLGPPVGRLRPGIVEPGADGSDGSPTPARPTDTVRVEVTNTAPVPITVTSHYHFFEVNPRLRFDRSAGYGRHLAVPSGGHVRFDPGIATVVDLAPVAGDRVVIGFAGLVDGPLDTPGAKEEALTKARACGFLDSALEGRPGGDGSTSGSPDTAIGAALALVRDDAR